MITGASGSGKTVSSLLIAKGIVNSMFPELSEEEQWEKIAVIDTEHCRSEMYCNTTIDNVHIGAFNIYDLTAPYTVKRYISAFNECKKAQCEVIIIDSITHAWSGEGGILDKVNAIGGKIQDWNQVKPDEKAFLSLLFDTDVHVIATARSKQGYEITRNDVGKVIVEKVGFQPEQRKDLEYEFAIVFQLYQDHTAEVTKDNSNSFEGRFILDDKVGQSIYDWAEEGIDLKAKKKEEKQEKITSIEAEARKSEEAQRMLEEIISKMNGIALTEFSDEALNRAEEILKAINQQ